MQTAIRNRYASKIMSSNTSVPLTFFEYGLNLKTAVKENENGADTRKHAGF